MINVLRIANFKSIKELGLNCKRVNLFIGEPNKGKSNILEALAFCALPYAFSTEGLIRNSDFSNLFFENDLSNPINISSERFSCDAKYENGNIKLLFKLNGKEAYTRDFFLSLDSKHLSGQQGSQLDLEIHPYFFKSMVRFDSKTYGFLAPPNGSNLFAILQTNKEVRSKVSDLIQETGFKLSLRQATSEIEISKEENSVLTSYPYQVISDTIQRLIFYMTAIETNKPGVSLVFEEPESNIFPYYTKYLAERIASDDKQFFLTTHNPYFLQAIIEKTLISDLSINLVKMDDYKTRIATLSETSIGKILELNSDVFLNFDKLVEE